MDWRTPSIAWPSHRTRSVITFDLLSGDHIYKQNKALSDRDQMITALPDVRTMTLDASDQFMVLACDGIWQVCFDSLMTSVRFSADDGNVWLYPVGFVAIWHSGNAVGRINKVTVCHAQLVQGWMLVFGRIYHLGV